MTSGTKKLRKLEAILWSIALPGFSQLLVGEYIKGVLFVILEFLININSSFNKAIMYSFNGQIDQAFQVIDFQWLMFYPCLYMFAMYDAYKKAMDEQEQYSYLPFAFGAYLVTVGLMLSPKLTFGGVNLGPIFWPMIFLIPGLLIGLFIRKLLMK